MGSIGLRIRKKTKLFPGISLNFSKSGISTSIKAGPVSWNSRSQKTSVNLPGPLSYQSISSKRQGMTKADLVDIARRAGLTGYSKLRKQELASLLQQHGLLWSVERQIDYTVISSKKTLRREQLDQVELLTLNIFRINSPDRKARAVARKAIEALRFS